jgi:hypothetical protein
MKTAKGQSSRQSDPPLFCPPQNSKGWQADLQMVANMKCGRRFMFSGKRIVQHRFEFIWIGRVEAKALLYKSIPPTFFIGGFLPDKRQWAEQLNEAELTAQLKYWLGIPLPTTNPPGIGIRSWDILEILKEERLRRSLFAQGLMASFDGKLLYAHTEEEVDNLLATKTCKNAINAFKLIADRDDVEVETIKGRYHYAKKKRQRGVKSK